VKQDQEQLKLQRQQSMVWYKILKKEEWSNNQRLREREENGK
jgi:hypothetical protein